MNTTTAIKVIEETVYSDGSGAAGLYEVYGMRFSGLHTGEKATVTPIGIRSGYRSGRERGMVASACKLIEKRLAAAVG